MEITKNKLLSIIEETNSIDIDEANRKERKRVSAYGENTKYRPISIKNGMVLAGDVIDRFDANMNPAEGVKLIGWEFRGGPIFYTNIEGFKELQQKDQNLWIKIKKLYKNINIENIRFVTNAKIPKHVARGILKTRSKFDPTVPEKEIDASVPPPLTSFSAANKIKRQLYGNIKKYFEDNPMMVSTFYLLSIPLIKTDRQYRSAVSDKDISNDEVNFKAKFGMGFKDAKTYQDILSSKNADVYDSSQENDKLIKQYYLKRQYNKIYRNWAEIQKNNGEWLRKTKIYDLDKFNRSKDPLDAGIITEFDVNGKREGDRFIWNAEFKVKFGTDLISRKNNYETKINFKTTKVAQINPSEEFNDDHSIVENFEILNAMIEAIYEIAEDIKGISPNEMLKNAVVPEYAYNDVEDEDLEESVDLMIKNLIRKIM